MAKEANLNDIAVVREACTTINEDVCNKTGIHYFDEWVTPDTLKHNEMFFITESSLRDLVENGSVCDRDANEVIEYFKSKESKVPMALYDLGWGYIFRVDETEFLICSSSWSSSTPFLERAERIVASDLY